MLLFLIMVACSVVSAADEEAKGMSSLLGMDLSEMQLLKLKKMREEMEQREFSIYTRSEQKLLDLKLELRKISYASTDEDIKQKAQNALQITKEIIALNAGILANRVDYILEAKKFLPEDRVKEFILSIDFELGVIGEHLSVVDLTFSSSDLNLSREQAKSYLRNRYDMESKELELYYRIKDKIIDLQQQLFANQPDLNSITSIISEITQFGNQMMENRFKTRLEAWDILTPEQKHIMINWIMLISKP